MRHYNLICPFKFVRRPYFSPTYHHSSSDKQTGTQKKSKIENVLSEIVGKLINRAFEEVAKVAGKELHIFRSLDYREKKAGFCKKEEMGNVRIVIGLELVN